MNSQSLTTDVTAARVAEFGEDTGTEQFPKKYFRYDVSTIAPDGQSTPRAPRYCASDQGAVALSTVIAGDLQYPNTIILQPAMSLEGGWSDTSNVPWLAFQRPGDGANVFTGPRINAGLLLDYFNHGYPANRARNSCELEILDAYAAAGLRDELTEQERQAIIVKP